MRFQIVTFLAALSYVTPTFAAPGVSPVRRGDALFTTVHGVVGDLQANVTKDLQSIVSTVTGDVTSIIVPSVAGNLIGVVGSLDAAIKTLVPAVAGAVVGLALGEVTSLVSDLSVVEDLVKNIVDVVITTVGTLAQDILDLLLPEVTAVLALLDPFVEPLIKFLETVVNQVEGGGALSAKVQSTAGSITTIVQSIVIPVGKVTSRAH